MNKIAVVTDTDSSLSPTLAGEYGIFQVPITVHFDDQSFTTGVDIDDCSLFEKVDRVNKLPTTSAPAPAAFAAAYQQAFETGAEKVICFTVSSKISGTYNAALNASENFPGRDIRVVDSLNLSLGQGFMAISAVEAIRRGASAEEAIASAEETGKGLHLYAVLATLKYLALSGRVGKFVAGMADTLNIKPILTMKDGHLVLLERVRTRKKAMDRMYELVDNALNGKDVKRIGVIHVNELNGAGEVAQLLAERYPLDQPIVIAEFTPGLSVHAGSGVVGIVVQAGMK